MEGASEVLGLLLRVGCVFALLFAVLAVLKRLDGAKGARRTSPMQVLGSTRVGKGAALTMVRIGDAEYVLGVTDHSVTLIKDGAAAPAPAVAPVETAGQDPSTSTAAASTPAGAPDFAAALGARLGARLSGRDTASALGAPTPPTAGEFLKNAYRVARRRPTESTELSTDAVTAALASVTGDTPLAPVIDLPLPRAARDDVAAPAAAPAPAPAPAPPRLVPDGSATPTSRHALRRAVARTEARRHEEHLWTRSCRPTRSTDLDSVLG